MHKGSDGPASEPVRTSGRVRRRPTAYGRSMYYYNTSTSSLIHKRRNRKNKTKTRTAASHIAKIMRHGSRSQRSTQPSTPPDSNNHNAEASNLRRSTRKRKETKNRDLYTTDDSSGSEDLDIMKATGKSMKNQVHNSACKDEPSSPKHKKIVETRQTPRREGLRPRRLKASREQLVLRFDDEQDTSEEKIDQEETENGNDIEYNEADDGQNEGDGEDVGDGDGDGDDDGDGDEDGDDEEGEEEQDGRRRYDLRNRADVRKLRPRSPRIVLRQGMGTKVGRDVRKGGSRVHKRHRMTRTDDSDDSLLVDELDQGPAIPWGRGGSRSGPPWLFGGLDTHGTTAWGLNVAASGWGHQGDAFATLTSGIQTAGPSSKGGADIQPLQVDESVSFDDIGGLSEYIDALKEMVFFPLLYPDFFASYHITPPRGVLLCGPPGTGKTLIARALACAASKAGQKVSFYMRKGADVLSKWVGEAERQLKLLFEEAQRNQPSIIFFDEIDGLAPVRSSKQEQIHNSIVSTLLALMDGLDSRGQVVLIGATNRIDAIDGALRRPGRFDREFNFPLPGCEARSEILDIHTRKWKHPPSRELKLELAASCVGYCGADLKALCTEAAIRAFREKYPQVYTSDDKFVIDVDSVRVEKYHFVEAMSTITPAAHRGAVVHSRPLSLVVAPCLQRHLRKSMNYISDIFPPLAVTSQLTKLAMLSSGSAIPLIYRPRLLLCGGEGSGLDHLGPAILHELEKFPVHSLGLPSLLSDPSAKTPDEALVHIFGEARRTTPSILYLPQLNLWWETAHEQLRAVLLTLLEELPSDLPILLLATSSVPPAEVDATASSIFSDRSVYQLGKPSTEDRFLFFDRLIEAALSVLLEGITKKSQESVFVPELPKAPKVASGPKVSELKAKVEAEQHALRRLRMCLRDVCNRLLYDKRFGAFHYPVSEEDAPNYRTIIQNPIDVAKLLQNVDSGQYITCSSFLQDVNLIVSNAKAYNGDDYNGARIVSRAHELRDAVHGMLSQMDPALVAYCDKIATEGGPEHIPDGLGVSTFPVIPVVQLGTVTRASARLRNVQLEVPVDQNNEACRRPKRNVEPQLELPVDQNYEASKQPKRNVEPQLEVHVDQNNEVLKWPNRNVEPTHAASTAEDKSRLQDSIHSKSSQEPETNETNPEVPESSHQHETSGEISGHTSHVIGSQDITMSDGEMTNQIESARRLFVERTENYDLPQLERLYTRIMKGIFDIKHKGDIDGTKPSILRYLLKFAEDEANF